jgi:hypothetical protein
MGIGVVLSAVGSVVVSPQLVRPALVLLCLVGAALAVGDLTSRDQWAIGVRRQTDSNWRHILGLRWAAALWGLDLGLGFTTFRVTSIFWLLVLVVAAERSVMPGAIVFLAYSLGLTAAVCCVQHVGIPCDIQRHLNPSLPQRLRLVGAAALMSWCVGIGASLLMAN